MIVHRTMTDVIPQTLDGQRFADLYEAKLRDAGCFVERKESTASIQITAAYSFDAEDNDNE